MQTIAEAKTFLRQNWEKGEHCPVCNHWVKLNPCTFHYSMAKVLIILYRATKSGAVDAEGYIHVENHLVDLGVKIKGVVGKMKYWGLVEDMPNDDPKKKRSGYWRITPKGIDFVTRGIEVPKKAYYYLDKAYRFSPETIGIVNALGERFNYQEMMGEYYLEHPEQQPQQKMF